MTVISQDNTMLRTAIERRQPLLPWPNVPRPVPWDLIFDRAAPLTVEIGFGNGEYLMRYAAEHPGENIVGLEVAWGSVYRALRRLRQSPRPNVRVLHHDARVLLERAFAPRSLAHAYCLFPCPWPKARHEKHRLFSHDFLCLLNSRLADGADALLVTDHHAYRDWVLEQLPDTGFDIDWRAVPPRFGTKYERKWRAGGQEDFFELRLQKTSHIDIPAKEDVAVEIRRVRQFNPARFAPRDAAGPTAVAFKERVYDPQREMALIRLVVAEEDLTQHFWMAVARTEDGHWVVRPAQGCAMVPTRGVQKAIDTVADAVRRSGEEE